MAGGHDDFSSHLRMHPAEKRIFSRLSETELELILCVHRCRFELAFRTVNSVRNVVVVDPGNLSAGLHRNHSRRECKIVNLNFTWRAGRCSGGAGMTNPAST